MMEFGTPVLMGYMKGVMVFHGSLFFFLVFPGGAIDVA